MRRRRALYLAIALLATVIGIAIARNTYWDEVTVHEPPHGEAAGDPYYATRQLLHRLGIGADRLVSLRQLPPPDGVLLAPDISEATARAELVRIERWVESGGRLVVSRSTIWSNPRLQSWSGITPAMHYVPEEDPKKPALASPCAALEERANGRPTGEALRACLSDPEASFASRRTPAWSLSNAYGMQMLRVAIGRGSIAVLECECLLQNGSVLHEDHARILLAAAPLRRGDRLSLADAGRSESLLALLWRLAAPALCAAGVAVALAVWRSWPRFGPLQPAPLPVRRSLAEQLRANARFAWRTRKLAALHQAVCRALWQAAQRRLPGYAHLDRTSRIASIARRTGLDADALGAALEDRAGGDAEAQSAEVLLLERARRGLELHAPQTTR